MIINQEGKSILKSEHGTVTLHDAKYVPNFGSSLISVAKLTNGGGTVTFTNKAAKLEKDGKTLMIANRVGDLYLIDTNHTSYSADGGNINGDNNNNNGMVTISTKNQAELQLFHQRCGHMSISGSRELVNKDALAGTTELAQLKLAINNNKHDTNISSHTMVGCEGCMLGKSHRQPFSNHSLKPDATDVLERIYCDLCGPINLKELSPFLLSVFQSLGSPLYVSAIVDSKSRNVHGDLLRTKDQAGDLYY